MRPDPALAPLVSAQALSVHQKKEWTEIISGWETSNRYEIASPEGGIAWFAGEVSDGLTSTLLRQFFRASRPFVIEVRTPAGAEVMRLERPWRFWLSHLDVRGPGGIHLGAIRQRFRFFTRHYDIEGPDGALLATLEGPFLRPWTFLLKKDGVEIGKIVKQWIGFGGEMFTDADRFGVEFRPGLRDLQLKQLALAATFLIDFVHFENKGN